MAHDCFLENKELEEIFKNLEVKDISKELRMTIHELDSYSLIIKNESNMGLEAISPSDSFYYTTDYLFQPWNPEEDAKTLIKEALKTKEFSQSCVVIQKEYGWSNHRINSALKFMEYNDLVQELDTCGGVQFYGCGSYILTTEAEFWIVNE